MCVTNEEGITFIYTGLGRCLFWTCVSSTRVGLYFGNYIFTLSFSCGAKFNSIGLYFLFIVFLWGILFFSDLLISSGASSNYLMVSFDFLTSSSLRKVVPKVNTSHCYQKHRHTQTIVAPLRLIILRPCSRRNINRKLLIYLTCSRLMIEPHRSASAWFLGPRSCGKLRG